MNSYSSFKFLRILRILRNIKSSILLRSLRSLSSLNSLIALATLALTLAACSQDGDPAAPAGAELQISVSAQGFVSDKPETRASDENYTTKFISGDQIGITVVKDNSVVSGQDNLPCTFNGTAWIPDGGKKILAVTGATYLVYYPYVATTMDGKKSATEIFNAFVVPDNQSNHDTQYTKADLMTGTGSVGGTTLTVALTHALALVEVSLPSGATNANIQIGSTDVTSKTYQLGGVHRYIVKPQTATLSGTYTQGSKNFAWQQAGASLTAGQYTKVNVKLPPTYDPGVVINNVKWATRNVDAVGTFAATPESPGKFYQWNRNVAWAATGGVSNWDSSVPSGIEWDTANDPSPAGWRVPTLAEIQSLLDDSKVTRGWTNQKGVNGYKFTDKTNPGNSIFLPAAGYRDSEDGTLDGAGTGGNYWSSTEYYDSNAYYLNFHSGGANWFNYDFRSYGYSVRCVAKQ